MLQQARPSVPVASSGRELASYLTESLPYDNAYGVVVFAGVHSHDKSVRFGTLTQRDSDAKYAFARDGLNVNLYWDRHFRQVKKMNEEEFHHVHFYGGEEHKDARDLTGKLTMRGFLGELGEALNGAVVKKKIRFRLAHIDMDAGSFMALFQFMAKYPISTLSFNRCALPGFAATAREYLSKCKYLERLSFGAVSGTETGDPLTNPLVAFVDAAEMGKLNIRYFDSYFTDIGDMGAQALSRLATIAPNFERMILEISEVGDVGLKAMADLLKSRKSSKFYLGLRGSRKVQNWDPIVKLLQIDNLIEFHYADLFNHENTHDGPSPNQLAVGLALAISRESKINNAIVAMLSTRIRRVQQTERRCALTILPDTVFRLLHEILWRLFPEEDLLGKYRESNEELHDEAASLLEYPVGRDEVGAGAEEEIDEYYGSSLLDEDEEDDEYEEDEE